ncbi:uncharacterized protein C3orf67 homolog isoform X1 [Osmerus eperlanus]|uniref:uncharacterized protein C3orf67 homolog isoform X1 n=1 Tax=Osmerus eperlanus TaxID=29151 RepID=UPI002E103603
MFKNDYQGGAVVEIFSAHGKDPVAKWKLCGGQSAIRKDFDKEVKGFVYILDGSSQTIKMQMPKDSKMSLCLVQRFLVLQLNVPLCKEFSTELVITDSGHLKRRLYFSTVHKEFSATPLHARIPFVGLKRCIWCNMCIDLVSFIAELFKGAGFLSLDGITLSASCKLRRIFTMKEEPTGASVGDLFLSGSGPRDPIPRSCQFPSDVQHVTQVLNMEKIRLAGARVAPVNCEYDQSGSARLTSARSLRTQEASHIAFGSRVAGPPPLTGRKNSGPQEECDPEPRPSQMWAAVERLNNADRNERQPCPCAQENDIVHELSVSTVQPGSLQPQPPRDRNRASDRLASRRLRLHSAGKEKPAPTGTSDMVRGFSGDMRASGQMSAPPSSRDKRSQQPLDLRQTREGRPTDEVLSHSPVEERSCWHPCSRLPARPKSRQPPTGLLPSHLQRGSDEGSEPHLSMDEVFTFASQPHSARRGQGRREPEEPKDEEKDLEISDIQMDTGGCRGARPEDDFIASESDEEEASTRFLQKRCSIVYIPATPRPSSPGGDTPLRPESSAADRTPIRRTIPADSPSSRSAEVAGMVPTRCLSPSTTTQGHGPGPEGVSRDQRCRTSVSRTSLKEIPPGDFRLLQVQGERSLARVGTSSCDLHLLSSLHMQEEEEELRMLASLRREQEEEEEMEGATGLTSSQIHQCNVSISTSSDDTSTWTLIPAPSNQGHHYQNEMNPLLHSNPREWMNVLSPPILSSSLLKGSGDTWDHHKDPTRGADGSDKENREENEEEYLNLLYDPCLNCYFDPHTGKYYELA